MSVKPHSECLKSKDPDEADHPSCHFRAGVQCVNEPCGNPHHVDRRAIRLPGRPSRVEEGPSL